MRTGNSNCDIINYLHFVGWWVNKFNPYMTRTNADFHVSPTEVVKTKMMGKTMRTHFSELKSHGVKICRLAYLSPPDLATEMVIILPLQLDGLTAFKVR